MLEDQDRSAAPRNLPDRVLVLLLFLAALVSAAVVLFLIWWLGPWVLPTRWRLVFVVPAALAVLTVALLWRSRRLWGRAAALATTIALLANGWLFFVADDTWQRLARFDEAHVRGQTTVCSQPLPEGTVRVSCERIWVVDFGGASTTCNHGVEVVLEGDGPPPRNQTTEAQLVETEQLGPERHRLVYWLDYIGPDLRCGPR